MSTSPDRRVVQWLQSDTAPKLQAGILAVQKTSSWPSSFSSSLPVPAPRLDSATAAS
jgi:hypothetical protein